MLDAHRQHQRAAAAVLRYLARGVGVTLHKRHQAGRGQRGILDRRPFRTDVRQVVPHSATAFHQLHLLLVNLDNSAIRVRASVKTDNEAIRQRADLVVVANPRHRAALRNDVFEIADQIKDLFLRHRIVVFLFNPDYFLRYTPVHIVRRLFINIPERIFQRIFVDPNTRSQFVAFEIFTRSLESLIVGVSIFFHIYNEMYWLIKFDFAKFANKNLFSKLFTANYSAISKVFRFKTPTPYI